MEQVKVNSEIIDVEILNKIAHHTEVLVDEAGYSVATVAPCYTPTDGPKDKEPPTDDDNNSKNSDTK